ncbi:MAG: hypothetical protein HUK24_08410 [Sphaerochaetaceae bacterium]|nr:hypothetical protein [Sphaerochaetaceae bacterium]
MDFVTMLPIVLPIVLFIFTLIILFSLRTKDKRSLTLAKKQTDNYKALVENALDSFKRYEAELEQKVAEKDELLKGMIVTVNGQINELKGYSDDLIKLRNAMDTYRKALDGLGTLTFDVGEKVKMVHTDSQALEQIRTIIDGFKMDMKDADEHLRKHEMKIIQLERDSKTSMNNAVAETNELMEKAMESIHVEATEVFSRFKDNTEKDTELRLRKIDEAFQAVIHTVQEFFGELENKLDVAREASKQLEAATKGIELPPPQDKGFVISAPEEQKKEQEYTPYGSYMDKENNLGNEEVSSIDIMDMDYSKEDDYDSSSSLPDWASSDYSGN